MTIDRAISRESLGESAYRYLFQSFLDNQFVPGTRLRMDELAEQMDISRTPVREALQRLEREGVIEPHGRRGYVVREISTDELDHRYQVREALEGFAAREVARAGGSAVRELRAAYERLLERPQVSAEQVFTANRDVHHAIVEALGNPLLTAASDREWNRALTSDIWARMLEHEDVVGDFDRAHRGIIEAIESGDEARAHREVIAHIRDGRRLHRI